MPHANVTHWVVFHVLLLVALGVEFLLLRKQSPARAYAATALWLTSGVLFGGYLYATLDHQLSQEFFAGFALEESLSIDNLFVFLLLFQSFQVKPDKQRKVLFWGILGAVVMRAAFIVAGVKLLDRFAWVTYIFAVLLLIAAIRLVLPQKHDKPAKPKWQQWLESKTTFSESQDGFFVQENGHRAPTVLLLALIAIAFTDFVFALDSIPAVLSITRHTFIAYTSNILAVMGLRSLFFVLAHALAKLKYLHYGLAAVLAFAAIKMIIDPWFEFTPLASLAIIFAILLVTILISLTLQHNEDEAAAH
ncbi:TerC/Alx family metal homeostasis membrane protein [Terriglobus aquaticus]|uniref:TerC/Alx family metal homeostasis membrane protein n=1 Tax=Terriglobus aquaticus TaxID=940139 RepID=A0ABW9KGJ8_9BACT|nr:TerC/Alx family metal homeostasis membrane protein [Terriglobus aquaticus]